MQVIEQKTVTLANGETLGYRVSGEGSKNVVLIHGNLVSSKYWERLMPTFPAEYKVYAIDLRGVGQSSYRKPIAAMADFADDVAQFVDALGLGRFILVGWSMGGGVAQLFAAQHPDTVEKLVLVDSVSPKGYLYPDPATGGYLQSREEVLTKGAGDLAGLLTQRSAAGFKAVWDAAVFNVTQPEAGWYQELVEDVLTCRFFPDCAWAMHTFNMASGHNGLVEGNGLIEQVTMPVLVIRGEGDVIISPEMAEATVAAIGPNARLELVAGAAHAPFIDQQQVFMSLFTGFVA